jgi:hypothetical protein
MHATYRTHLILYLITKIIFNEKFAVFSSLLLPHLCDIQIFVKQTWILLILHLNRASFLCYGLFAVWRNKHWVSVYVCRSYWRKDSCLDSPSTNIRDIHNAVTCGTAVSRSTDV